MTFCRNFLCHGAGKCADSSGGLLFASSPPAGKESPLFNGRVWFSALPGGNRNNNNGNFNNAGNNGNWWSSSPSGGNAWNRNLNNNNPDINRNNNNPRTGFSVRCLRDEWECLLERVSLWHPLLFF